MIKLDADDWLNEIAIFIMVEKLENNINAGIAYGNYFYTDENGKIIGVETRYEFDIEDSAGHLPPHGACTLFETNALKKAGGYSEKIINARSITTVTVTIGNGGSGTTYSSQGGRGGTTSFGSHLSASGGHGANTQGAHSGGVGGLGSGGNVNLFGGGGSGHGPSGAASGGASYFGGGSHGTHTSNAGYPGSHESHQAPGGGGTGAYTTHTRGANVKHGCVIVWEYA